LSGDPESKILGCRLSLPSPVGLMEDPEPGIFRRSLREMLFDGDDFAAAGWRDLDQQTAFPAGSSWHVEDAGSGAEISSSPPTVGCCASSWWDGLVDSGRCARLGGRIQRLGRPDCRAVAAPRAALQAQPWSPSRAMYEPGAHFNPALGDPAPTCRVSSPNCWLEPPATTAGRTGPAPQWASRCQGLPNAAWYGCCGTVLADPGDPLAKRDDASDKLLGFRCETETPPCPNARNSLGPCSVSSQPGLGQGCRAAEQIVLD